uniref:tRNA-splicing endonuclease subunit Sen15-like n=1 Tax=Saccoglossus kowalevskii TaxID=10224 RepID=A0ABM0MSP5_SACKO|nr:PREDICTED: tRNA-splicing endonuclease subunit Sen15-like [Saccoglossus kowalevskii]
MVYLAGVANKKDEVQHILPISSDMPLSNQRLQQFIKLLKPHKCKEDLSPSGSSDVITSSKHSFVQLAVNDSDSTIVYYKISDELIPPDPPKQTLLKEVGKGKRRKRKAILLPQQPDEPVTDDENWGDEL